MVENGAFTIALKNSVLLELMQCYATVGAYCFRLKLKQNALQEEKPNAERISSRVYAYKIENIMKEPADLFSHGLRICYSGTEVTVPFQSAVQPRPVIMPVSRMRKTPRYKSIKLPVSGVTWLAFCA